MLSHYCNSNKKLVLDLVYIQAVKFRASRKLKSNFVLQRATKHGAKSAVLRKHGVFCGLFFVLFFPGHNESCLSAPLEFRIKEPKTGALILGVRLRRRLLLEQEVQ